MPLIILFILLGLGFLGGGAAAIIDGMPYLVLERGFTQVIIGTVVAVAGVIMLALAQVLAKLRALENRLSGATMALSLAGAAGIAPREPSLPVPPLAAEPVAPAGATAAAAVAGALAGAGLAGAGAATAAPPVVPESNDKADEPDLFGAHLATVLDREAEAPSETERAAAGPALAEAAAEPDEAETGLADADDPPVLEALSLVDQEPASPAEPADHGEGALPSAADDLPSVLVETQDAAADHLPEATPPEAGTEAATAPLAADIDDPLTPAPPLATAEDDEFGRLRESLAGLGLGPVGGRIEPRFDTVGPSAGPDDLAAAASWMDSALSRRPAEPEAPGAIEVVPPPLRLEPTLSADRSWPMLDSDDRTVPAWPPQTREVPVAEPVVGAVAVWPEPAQHEPEIEPPAAAAEEAPAASDEGIVGAYQVGEAHFTIYADGSIKARTPEGDYSFASMDELKIYLASEKSRLGS
jgi:hypothetical protein